MHPDAMDWSAREMWGRLTLPQRKELIAQFGLPERFVREPLRPSLKEISADAVSAMARMVSKKGK
jgi:hypothetical protein